MKSIKVAFLGVVALGMLGAYAYDYNVRMPSSMACPRWKGAQAGEWTMDYEAARQQAMAEGKGLLLLTTGSWWCPHCEAFEQKVMLDHSTQWRNYIKEKGFYLVMLDFPYRGHVDDEQLWKSKYPVYGDGWGFQCWLYDEDYLRENDLSKEDGLNAIVDMYRLQDSLALDSATTVTINKWDGSEEITYGRVGYPTLIVYLPDGSEAGRFSPGSTYLESDEAYNYVVEKIDSIIDEALDKECGLCSEPDEWGLPGKRTEYYNGWLKDDANGIVGTLEVKTGRKNKLDEIKVSATVTIDGKKQRFSGVGQSCCIDYVVLDSNNGTDAVLELLLDENGMSGIYVNGEDIFTVAGARNVFKASKSDAVAKARKELLVPGTWTFSMAVMNAPSDFAGGYGAFSVKVAKSGKATVRGVLPDGFAVYNASMAIIGDSNTYCVPISYYRKKASFGCCLWFKDGWLFNISDLHAWDSSGKHTFTAGWRPIYSSVPGIGEIKGDYELLLPREPETIGGNPIVVDPNGDSIEVKGKVLKGTEDTKFKATLSAQTGLLSGSMKFYIEKPDGRVASKLFKVSGVFIDGTAYCTSTSSSLGSVAVKVSACDACED